MYNKNVIHKWDRLCGARWIMRDLPNYAQGHQLCAKLCARIIAKFNDPYPKPPHFAAFRTAIHSFVTGEPRDFKFGTLIYHSKSHPADANLPWKGRGQLHLSNFYIVDFATASRRYTGDIHNSSVVGLFMTSIGQWKRLGRVMVECTCLLHIAPL